MCACAFGQAAPLVKWKWAHTIDFKIKRPLYERRRGRAERLQLWAGGPGDTDIMVRATPVSQHERAMIVNDLRELGREWAIYECEYEPRIGRWYLKTLRRDKTAANFVTTVVGTLETIVDNVTVDELVRFGQSKRGASS